MKVEQATTAWRLHQWRRQRQLPVQLRSGEPGGRLVARHPARDERHLRYRTVACVHLGERGHRPGYGARGFGRVGIIGPAARSAGVCTARWSTAGRAACAARGGTPPQCRCGGGKHEHHFPGLDEAVAASSPRSAARKSFGDPLHRKTRWRQQPMAMVPFDVHESSPLLPYDAGQQRPRRRAIPRAVRTNLMQNPGCAAATSRATGTRSPVAAPATARRFRP